jgi:hypothetical protein
MTKEQFDIFWTLTYPETIPVSHYFKDNFRDKWFRIHSLPESKRYADTEEELTCLLTRQNQIITDLLGDNTKIFLVIGEYNWDEQASFTTDEEEIFKPYNFIRLDNIDLFKLFPEEYNNGEFYRPAFAVTIWKTNQFDDLLKEIANGGNKAFIASVDKSILIAPYDGGVDFVLEDTEKRDFYKQKYKEWLSIREDGL